MKTTFKKIITYILILESRLVLWKYKPKIVAITGSVGKTSTKDAVYAVLSKFTYVRKSEKSYNSQIGLPLTVLGCTNGWNDPMAWFKNICFGFWLFVWPHKYPEWLVLEVGVGKPGDMKQTASWLKTNAVIITAIGETPAHIEFFSSRDNLIEEKSGLIKTLKKNGILILNADDDAVLGMKNKCKNRVVTYGFNEKSDVTGASENIFYDDSVSVGNSFNEPKGIIFRVDTGGSSLPVIIEGVFGINHVYASLASIAFAYGLKFNIVDAVNSLKKYDVPPGRMRLISGINNSLILDDTYNSSPFACISALKTLSEVKTKGKKIAVLGDMLELGKHTEDAHRDIGKYAKDHSDILFVVGPRAKTIAVGAMENGMLKENIFEFGSSFEAGDFLKTFINEGDLILVKGSQGMRMEKTVEKIMAHPEQKNKFLVRQEEEWIAKK
ncbi:hypothetical protein K8Q94_00620 [Candidatus Nomurabacteria bacterium]|nr:hypothetical protein [Candidatus Nomurabacteria bacterium]